MLRYFNILLIERLFIGQISSSHSHVIRESGEWLLVLYTLGTDVISLPLAGLNVACSSPGHQPKCYTMFAKHLASQQLHTRRLSLPISLTVVTVSATLLHGLL